MTELLALATRKLNLDAPATRIFTSGGDEMDDDDAVQLIRDEEVLYVSCGEDFGPTTAVLVAAAPPEPAAVEETPAAPAVMEPPAPVNATPQPPPPGIPTPPPPAAPAMPSEEEQLAWAMQQPLATGAAPMSNESIREAVREFAAESADFNSPNAEAKWGRIADWNVLQVTDMNLLFEGKRKFNSDVSKWNVGNVTDMNVSRFRARPRRRARAARARRSSGASAAASAVRCCDGAAA